MAEKPIDNLIRHLPEEAQAQMLQVFDWFNANVSKLEEAYQEIGLKFDRVSQELEDKNNKLVGSFVENERVKTQLRSILESLDSGVIMIDTAECITVFNPAAERIYGYPAEKVLGQSYRAVFKAEAADHFPLIETLNNRHNFSSHEKYWTIGEISKPIGFTTNVVYSPQGEVLGAVEVSSDLTGLKQMQQQMQHAKTLAALGEMAATVAHEIRNPLGGIGGFAGLLERDLEPDDPRRTLVRKIVQGVSSLNKIVSNLLVYTRPMELQVRKLDFIEWLDDILRYAELEAEKEGGGIRMERNYAFESFEVRIDPEKFQQVMLNLIFNAMQALGDSGTIEIAVALNDSDFLIVSVIDDGPGIPKENLDKLFNPFFTTREHGTGLGLAIVQRIVELHGGEVSVFSEPGKGTRFEIAVDPRGRIYG